MFGYGSIVDARETAAVLALSRTKIPNLPWNRLAGAIEEAGSALALLEELDPSAGRLFEVRERGVLDALENQVHTWNAEGISLVTVLDTSYPVNLRMVHDRPSVLFIRGHLAPDDERSVAVVGTRSATPDGLALARSIAGGLSDAGYVVVSGLAAGIDSAAHIAALKNDRRTLAVIGTGL